MATLQELNSRLQAIKGNLSTYEQQKDSALTELRSTNANLKNLGKNIRELEGQISAIDTTISLQQDDAIRTQLEEQKRALEEEKKAKETERDRTIELGRAKKDAEQNIEKANQEMQEIIDEFASDPRINAYLQEAISIKYDEQVALKQQEKVNRQKLNESFSLDLQNDKVFGTLVSDLRENYTKLKALPTFALDDEAKKNAANVRGAFTKSVNKLRAAISSRPEYADLILTEEDFEAIVAGPNADGRYEIPSLEESVTKIDTVVAELEERKVKVLERIQKVLVAERIDPAEESRIDAEIAAQEQIISDSDGKISAEDAELSRLATEIKDLKATFATVDTSVQETALSEAQAKAKEIEDEMSENKAKADGIDTEIAGIDTKLSAIGFDQATYDDLQAKASIPTELSNEQEEARKDYDEAVKALRDKGYINKDTYPALESCKTEFETFKAADLAVRKAFLECQTSNTPASKDALKKAMEEYTKASGDLLNVKGMEGLTVENWHDYLVRQIAREAKNGEIDEAYYSGTMQSRLDNIPAEFKSQFKNSPHEMDSKMDPVRRSVSELSKQQEEFLKGGNVQYSDVESKLEEYGLAMEGLFQTLRQKGASTLSSIGDLYSKLKGQLTNSKLFGFFSKIKNFFSRNSAAKISGTKSETDMKEIGDLLDNLADKKEALANVDLEVQEYIEEKLSQDEINELRSQEAKKAETDQLMSERQGKVGEKTDLGTRYAELTAEKAAADAVVAQRQQELDDEKAKGTATPEQQADLDKLEDERKTHEAEKQNAEKAKADAEKAKADLQQEKSQLKPTRPDEVIGNSREIAHGKGQEIKQEALNRFDSDDER